MNNRRKLAIALGVGMLTMLALMTYLIWSGYRDAIKDAETRTKDYAEILEARLEATLRRADATGAHHPACGAEQGCGIR